ncbi:unnamed protein product [Cylicostephanus goldi]|uniref:Uncharacterized protein n=1 Tax=Cylicostephanus goldi TaxID=71465 RepID=A0A3P6QH39_CYLGO|nr:unnamed protein product [Cylicostephanus goldi]
MMEQSCDCGFDATLYCEKLSGQLVRGNETNVSVGCSREAVLDHNGIPLVSDYKLLTAIGFVRAVLMP